MQVWLEKFADAMEKRVTTKQLELKLAATCQEVVSGAEAAIRSIADTAASRAANAAVESISMQMNQIDGRVDDLQRDMAAYRSSSSLSSRDVMEVQRLLQHKADRSYVDQQCASVLSHVDGKAGKDDMERELAKKLDIRTFLASSNAAGVRALHGI